MINGWGVCPPVPVTCASDVTGDGQVDLADMEDLLTNWGACR